VYVFVCCQSYQINSHSLPLGKYIHFGLLCLKPSCLIVPQFCDLIGDWLIPPPESKMGSETFTGR